MHPDFFADTFTDHVQDAAENMIVTDISGTAKPESAKLGSGCHLTSKFRAS